MLTFRRSFGREPLFSENRYGGHVMAQARLPLLVGIADTWRVDGNGTIQALPAWPIGTSVTLIVMGTQTYVASSNLVCPMNRNISAVSGDLILAMSLGDGKWTLAWEAIASFNGPLLTQAVSGATYAFASDRRRAVDAALEQRHRRCKTHCRRRRSCLPAASFTSRTRMPARSTRSTSAAR
jgi:hypothetical protein